MSDYTDGMFCLFIPWCVMLSKVSKFKEKPSKPNDFGGASISVLCVSM